MAGLNAAQVRDIIVRPALVAIDLWSLPAEALVLGTGAQESDGFAYIKQIGKGPALGLFQMEPETYYGDYKWVAARPDLDAKVRALVSKANADEPTAPDCEELAYNPRFAAAMCRIHYAQLAFELPGQWDVNGLAQKWKQFYNSYLGAGTVQQFTDHYRAYIVPILVG